MIPEWAPNLHPMVVHFPIVLFLAACAVDAAALLLRKRPALRTSATALYVAGAVATLAGFLSGQQAADSVQISGYVNTLLTDHADWAAIMLWFFGIYAGLRLLLWWKGRGLVLSGAAFLVGAGGLVLVFGTAERGARLVFEHGVGVGRVSDLEEELLRRDLALAEAGAPRIKEDGSWSWIPGPHATEAFRQGFVMLSDTGFTAETRADSALALTIQDAVLFFVVDAQLGSVQIDAAMDWRAFTGSVQIVHHVRDTLNYLFTEVQGDVMRQGRVVAGMPDLMDERPYSGPASGGIRVVADRTHFRAYAGGGLVTHGHGAEPEPGSVGLRLRGSGTVLLGAVQVQALR